MIMTKKKNKQLIDLKKIKQGVIWTVILSEPKSRNYSHQPPVKTK